jgi:hypothetical protein
MAVRAGSCRGFVEEYMSDDADIASGKFAMKTATMKATLNEPIARSGTLHS